MRIYDPVASLDRVFFRDSITETDIQSELYSKLRTDGFSVKSSVGIRQKAKGIGIVLDLVVYKNREAVAIIEVKSPERGPTEDLDATLQGAKYKCFGIPVILFWDLSFYEDLKAYLKNEKTVENSKPKNRTYDKNALYHLQHSLDIASMRSFDLRNFSKEFQDLERLLEEKRNRVKTILEGIQ